MKAEVKMDAKRLIAEVYKRPALWNQKHISYHNRDVTNRVWMEIATLFKLPKQLLKSKWKGLRDTFRAELKKEHAYRNIKLGQNRPLWKHFKTLQFLKEQMLPRPPIWERASCHAANERAVRDNSASNKPQLRPVLRRRLNNNNTTGTVEVTDSITKNKARNGSENSTRTEHENSRETSRENVMTLLMDFDATDTLADQIVDDAARSTKDCCNKRPVNVLPVKIEPAEHCDVEVIEANFDHRDNPSLPVIPQLIDIKMPLDINDRHSNNPIDGAVNDRHDDNYYFFVSLLPHIRSLPAERRMLLRMQMQQLVYEEVYKKSPASSGFNHRAIARTNSISNSASPLRDK